MELKTMRELHDEYSYAGWLVVDENDNDAMENRRRLMAAVTVLRPEYGDDIVGVMNDLTEFHAAGCPEDDADRWVMMDYSVFKDTLEQARLTLIAAENAKNAELLSCLDGLSPEEESDSEMADLAKATMDI